MNEIWEVTTEGDVEGKTTVSLGLFQGNPVDIALFLGKKSYYQLQFKKPKNLEVTIVTKEDRQSETVYVYKGIGSAVSREDWALYAKNNKVSLKEGNYYESLILTDLTFDKERAKRSQLIKEKNLTSEDLVLLGVK